MAEVDVDIIMRVRELGQQCNGSQGFTLPTEQAIIAAMLALRDEVRADCLSISALPETESASSIFEVLMHAQGNASTNYKIALDRSHPDEILSWNFVAGNQGALLRASVRAKNIRSATDQVDKLRKALQEEGRWAPQ